MMRMQALGVLEMLRTGKLLEPGGHHMLVYDQLMTLRLLITKYAEAYLPQNEIILIASQYDAVENIKSALEVEEIDVKHHIANGTLFIIDAQRGYQEVDTRGTFKLAMSLILRARKEGRRGVTWIGDMGSFFSFDKIPDLVDYELSCPAKYEAIIKTLCCYHKTDFRNLSKAQGNKLIQHHLKSIFVEQ